MNKSFFSGAFIVILASISAQASDQEFDKPASAIPSTFHMLVVCPHLQDNIPVVYTSKALVRSFEDFQNICWEQVVTSKPYLSDYKLRAILTCGKTLNSKNFEKYRKNFSNYTDLHICVEEKERSL
jgi:hypothetical protein